MEQLLLRSPLARLEAVAERALKEVELRRYHRALPRVLVALRGHRLQPRAQLIALPPQLLCAVLCVDSTRFGGRDGLRAQISCLCPERGGVLL